MLNSIPFGRIGSKRYLYKEILPYIPEHDTYIEPFFGGGAIFFLKDKVKKNIINDFDINLMNDYRNILEIEPGASTEDLHYFKTSPEIKDWVQNTRSTPLNDFIKAVYVRNCTFGSSGRGNYYKFYDPLKRVKKIPNYQKKLKDTIIHTRDYSWILEKYDSPTSWIFLDPPYENSKRLYKHYTIDFEELKNNLKKLKGKFLLTLNDSPLIRDIFKEFRIIEIEVRKTGNVGVGAKKRNELFIMNY